MKEWILIITEYATIIINALAVLIIFYGTIDAFVRFLRNLFGTTNAHLEFRQLFLRYARFLIGGLTFQLGADIIETAIAPSWEEIGHLAAIAVIRTFLNFFLERDIFEVKERRASPTPGERTSPSSG